MTPSVEQAANTHDSICSSAQKLAHSQTPHTHIPKLPKCTHTILQPLGKRQAFGCHSADRSSASSRISRFQKASRFFTCTHTDRHTHTRTHTCSPLRYTEYPLMPQGVRLGSVQLTTAPRDVLPDTVSPVGVPGMPGTTVAFSGDVYVTKPLLFVTLTE